MTVVTVLVLVAYSTPVLGVRTVVVNGVAMDARQKVLDAAGVPMGTPMLQVDTSEVRDRLGSVPEVQSAKVSLSWPSTLRLDIVERQPAVFMLASNGIQLVDASGVSFATVPQPPEGIPELRVRGSAKPDVMARSASTVLTSLPPELRADVTTVVADSPYDIRVLLRGQREVRWGDVGDSGRKAAILRTLLTRPGHIYDVTAPELPTVG